MTKRDFLVFADIIGATLYVARKSGGEEMRTAVYDTLYETATAYFLADNPRFDLTRFAYAVAQSENENGLRAAISEINRRRDATLGENHHVR